jgi:ACS family hexuronate transporter-like MFS transporter
MATPSTLVRPARRRKSETTSFRWVICGLLFFAATINYIDRQVIGWSEIDYGDIVFAFQLAYAIGFVFAGRIIDRLGTKLGLALALVAWSAAALAHAGATTYGAGAAAVLAVFNLRYTAWVARFIAARFALGIRESGSFPASIKTVAEWFPRRDRAFATGVFNAGTNVGAVITPLVVPWITIQLGWRWAFAVTGALGFAWLLTWWALYEAPHRHPRVSSGELALIQEDAGEKQATIPWRALLPHRETWAFAIGKLLTDPIWWLYLFWVPDFFSRTHGLSLSESGPPIVVIYLMADVGSVGGGWLSSMLIRRGWSLNAARKTAMLICACAVVPIVLAPRVTGEWTAVALIGLAAAAHQAGPRICSRSRPMYFRSQLSDRSSASAALPAQLAGC